jgi:hypothetical protein
MRLFGKSPEPEPVPARLRVHHPWNPPEAELPAIVPIDTLRFEQSEQAAVAITGLLAYSRGFEFAVTRLIRPGVPGMDEEARLPKDTPAARRALAGRLMDQQYFQISLQLSDGRTVVSERRRGDTEPPGPILQQRGGGGTSHFQQLRWWSWPLPPAGLLEFICRWPSYGMTETRVSIDAQLIIDAARRSVRPWPENQTPEP